MQKHAKYMLDTTPCKCYGKYGNALCLITAIAISSCEVAAYSKGAGL